MLQTHILDAANIWHVFCPNHQMCQPQTVWWHFGISHGATLLPLVYIFRARLFSSTALHDTCSTGIRGPLKKLPQIDKFVKRLYLVIWQSSKNRYLGWCISNSSAWGLEHPRASASEMNWGGYFACVLIHIIGPYLVLCSDTWQSELFNGVAAGSFFQFFRGKNFGFRVRLYGGKVALLRILLYPISKSTNSKHWM